MDRQKHDEHQESIRWLLSFVEAYATHGRTVAQNSTQPAQRCRQRKTRIVNFVSELHTLLEGFANERSMDIIFDAVNAVIDDSRRDEALREWFRAVDLYIRRIGYIPIPCVEYTDDSLDVFVENLTLQGCNLFPNIVALEANNFVKFSPYNAITDDHHHRTTLTLRQMQADMCGVTFRYRSKSVFLRYRFPISRTCSSA
ncbi:hypothetical protein B0H34DRAFT_801342 [Crassisporium funariophilum]|nr:hypothetical protein B0H34DRAFT_801342 [Crassisporium funariophilum]